MVCLGGGKKEREGERERECVCVCVCVMCAYIISCHKSWGGNIICYTMWLPVLFSCIICICYLKHSTVLHVWSVAWNWMLLFRFSEWCHGNWYACRIVPFVFVSSILFPSWCLLCFHLQLFVYQKSGMTP